MGLRITVLVAAWLVVASGIIIFIPLPHSDYTRLGTPSPSPIGQPFFSVSEAIQTLAVNSTHHHGFDIIHDSKIVTINEFVDGFARRYLAYDSHNDGDRINLYYSNSTSGPWTEYSGNPILGVTPARYRDPTVVLEGTTIHMFVSEESSKQIGHYTSADGIHFSFAEYITRIGYLYGTPAPYCFRDVLSGDWVLIWFDSSGTAPRQDYTYLRKSTTIAGLQSALNVTLVKYKENLVRGYPSMMYFGDRYWLAVEGRDTALWEVHILWSNSLMGEYQYIAGDPLFSNDDACPRFAVVNWSTAYLFTDYGSNPVRWYQRHYVISNSISYEIALGSNRLSGVAVNDSVFTRTSEDFSESISRATNQIPLASAKSISSPHYAMVSCRLTFDSP